MATPTQSDKESIDKAKRQLKPEILKMSGYTAPPQGHVIAKLNQNENPYELPPESKEEVIRELKRMEWSRYPVYEPMEVRQRLAARFNLETDQIILGNGSNQLLYTVMNAVVSKGDKVLISPPSFSLFEVVANLNEAEMIRIIREPDLSYHSQKIIQAASKAKLTLISSPCNPTGKIMDLNLLKKILDKTEGLVLWDEAYGEFCHSSAIPLIRQYPNLLVIRTFSKAFALAGFRIGYLMAREEIADEIRKINLPYNLNLMSILLACKCLDNIKWMEDQVQKIILGRDWLSTEMKSIPGVILYPSEANFILFRVPDGPQVLHQLQKNGVLVRNMGDYPLLENCLRVNVGKPKENQIFIKNT